MNKACRIATAQAAMMALVNLLAAVHAQEVPVYQSRFPDAPPARVGQASRGAAERLQLVVLAPEQKGASARSVPVLYWYQSAASEKLLEFVVQERGAGKPLIEFLIEHAGAAGYHSIDLGSLGVTLLSGLEYEWSVALIVDPAHRASDLFSRGVVEYVPGNEIAAQSEDERIRAFLAAGYWYDALALLMQIIERNPERADLKQWRGKLLAAQGLVGSP